MSPLHACSYVKHFNSSIRFLHGYTYGFDAIFDVEIRLSLGSIAKYFQFIWIAFYFADEIVYDAVLTPWTNYVG